MAKVVGISPSSLRRIWKGHGLQPHRVRSFKPSNDPKFAEKLKEVVGLCIDSPDHAVVLSLEEKSQIQALDRTQPGLPMKKGRCATKRPIVLPLMLGLAACAAEYSKSEAPDTLRVDGSDSRSELAFGAGSAGLSPSELRKLDGWVLSGAIRPADRVEVAAAGPPGLAEQRADAISRELLRCGIVTQTLALDTVPANHAIVSIGR